VNDRALHLEEPQVLAGGRSTFCKWALMDGPYRSDSTIHVGTIRVSIIGLKSLAQRMAEWMCEWKEPIESLPRSRQSVNKQLFPDFPGSARAFGAMFETSATLCRYVTLADVGSLPQSPSARLESLVDLFAGKMRSVLEANEEKPDVFLCVIGRDMYDDCHVVEHEGRAHRSQLEANPYQMNLFSDLDAFNPANEFRPGHNFRSYLKKVVMSPGICRPIQIILEDTLDFGSGQNKATKTWNVCTGVYYKSGQLPWVLSNLDREACFMGVSHYRSWSEQGLVMHTSLAHLFSNGYDSVVSKGRRMSVDKETLVPMIDRAHAESLMDSSLAQYKRTRGRAPSRVVLHKTTLFNKEEVAGYEYILSGAGLQYDLVTLSKSGLRLLRRGAYPVPRGTFWELSEDRHFLYTKGFVPELGTYPGVHVPAPFMLLRPRGDSAPKQVASEVLALTKLNWNTADYCCGVPITIGFARGVGQVLKEFDSDPKCTYEPAESYRFYM